MATTGTGRQGSSGMGATDRSTTTGTQQSGDAADRRAAGGGNESSGIAQTLRDTTYRSIDTQKSRASDTLGSLAGAVREMTQPLRDGGQAQMADYVNKAADGIERWASQLRQQDLEDAVRAVEQFARRQPAMFLGLAFGAGLVAARFLKSSSRDDGLRSYGGNFAVGAGRATSIGSTGLGTAGVGPRPTSVGSSDFATGGTGSVSGDIPRVSGDIRSAGEVL